MTRLSRGVRRGVSGRAACEQYTVKAGVTRGLCGGGLERPGPWRGAQWAGLFPGSAGPPGAARRARRRHGGPSWGAAEGGHVERARALPSRLLRAEGVALDDPRGDADREEQPQALPVELGRLVVPEGVRTGALLYVACS